MAGDSLVSAMQTQRRRKGPRVKPQPQRTCIACRDKTSKRALIRIVRSPDGTVSVDPTGRADGRGAYLCGDQACWSRALDSNLLGHALRIDIDEASRAILSTFAASLDSTTKSDRADS
ncbi:YlxR family protein [soil metagenome]